MSGFFDRLFGRSAGDEPAVRPRIEPWQPAGSVDLLPWGEVVDETVAPALEGPRTAQETQPAQESGPHVEAGTTTDSAPLRPPDGILRPPVDRTLRPLPARLEDGRPPSSVVVAPNALPAVRHDAPPDQPHVARVKPIDTAAAGITAHSRPTEEVISVQRRPGASKASAASRTGPRRLPVPLAPTPGRVQRGTTIHATAVAQPPDVIISIGRIEVRAAPEASIPRPRGVPPDTSRLERYLEARIGRSP